MDFLSFRSSAIQGIAWRLSDNGNRAALYCVGNKLCAVHIHAGVCDVKCAGNDPGGFVGDEEDFEIWEIRVLRFVPSTVEGG